MLNLRHVKWWWQRRTRGFDDRELWNLDFTIINFTLPRLKEFSKQTASFPTDNWEEILNKMIFAMEICIQSGGPLFPNDPNYNKFKEGMNLFHEYFFNLWD